MFSLTEDSRSFFMRGLDVIDWIEPLLLLPAIDSIFFLDIKVIGDPRPRPMLHNSQCSLFCALFSLQVGVPPLYLRVVLFILSFLSASFLPSLCTPCILSSAHRTATAVHLSLPLQHCELPICQGPGGFVFAKLLGCGFVQARLLGCGHRAKASQQLS